MVLESINELKQELCTIQSIPSVITQLGYLEPGHGVKGKQRWLSSPADLKDMYKSKDKILLWCMGQLPVSSKRAHSPYPEESAKKKSKYSSHTDKMVEVETIEEKILLQ